MPMQSPGDLLALSAEGLAVTAGEREILHGLTVQLTVGESLAIMGPSGSGKTTLLMLLAGMTAPDKGSVFIAGIELASLSKRQRAAVRLRQVGVVYQFGELLPELSPLENVAIPALLAGMSRDEAFAEAADLLENLGVHVEGNGLTSTLSGGGSGSVSPLLEH